MISGARKPVGSGGSGVSEAEWQQLELGSFVRDLPAWLDLAARYPGRVLELGSGAGRVCLHLAAAGCGMIALESHPDLALELRRKAARSDLDLEVIDGPVESVALPEASPGLIIAPMQFIHYLSPDTAHAVLARFTDGPATPPAIGLAVLRDDEIDLGEYSTPSVPDMVESDGWVLSSQISRVLSTRNKVLIERQREAVSPAGIRQVQRTTETLYRYRKGEIEAMMHDILYRLISISVLPEEPGMVPADLMLFEPDFEREFT